MQNLDYGRYHLDYCVYLKRLGDWSYIILLLYVDDMLVVGNSMHDISDLKRNLESIFSMKDLEATKKYPWCENHERQEESEVGTILGGVHREIFKKV